jgi:Spy/CpxP family protein refolding chaperone
MKKILMILLSTVLLTSTMAIAQEKERQERNFRPGKFMEALKLTDNQKEQFQKTRFETEKKNIQIRAQLETAHLELRKLLTTDSPDIPAVEKKISEISSITSTLEINRFEAWAANNKILTPEQQKIWKRALLKRSNERFMEFRNRMHQGKYRSENLPQPGGDEMSDQPMDVEPPMMGFPD